MHTWLRRLLFSSSDKPEEATEPVPAAGTTLASDAITKCSRPSQKKQVRFTDVIVGNNAGPAECQGLSEDVLSHVFEHFLPVVPANRPSHNSQLSETSARNRCTLNRAAQVSRSWHTVAQPLLWRHISFSVIPEMRHPDVAKPEYASYTHHLEYARFDSFYPRQAEQVVQLAHALSIFTNIVSLTMLVDYQEWGISGDTAALAQVLDAAIANLPWLRFVAVLKPENRPLSGTDWSNGLSEGEVMLPDFKGHVTISQEPYGPLGADVSSLSYELSVIQTDGLVRLLSGIDHSALMHLSITAPILDSPTDLLAIEGRAPNLRTLWIGRMKWYTDASDGNPVLPLLPFGAFSSLESLVFEVPMNRSLSSSGFELPGTLRKLIVLEADADAYEALLQVHLPASLEDLALYERFRAGSDIIRPLLLKCTAAKVQLWRACPFGLYSMSQYDRTWFDRYAIYDALKAQRILPFCVMEQEDELAKTQHDEEV